MKLEFIMLGATLALALGNILWAGSVRTKQYGTNWNMGARDAEMPPLNPQLTMNMACTLFGLTPEEAIAGMTINAARALGLAHDIGTVEAGKAADLCAWRVDDLSELAYWIGLPGPERRIFGGLDGEGRMIA